jgi:signal transduction histidine kinase
MRRKGAGGDGEGLRVIEEEAVQCQRIVAGLLDLARPPSLSVAQMDLGALVYDCVDRLRASGRTADVAIDVTRVESHVTALGDDTRFRQVVTNLLLNAVEASAPGQVVTVEVRPEGNRALLGVLDQGLGLTEEMRQRVFEPFFTTKAKGSGLGLAVAHAVVDAHQGEIRLDPGPLGGTRAVVLLPAPPQTVRS